MNNPNEAIRIFNECPTPDIPIWLGPVKVVDHDGKFKTDKQGERGLYGGLYDDNLIALARVTKNIGAGYHIDPVHLNRIESVTSEPLTIRIDPWRGLNEWEMFNVSACRRFDQVTDALLRVVKQVKVETFFIHHEPQNMGPGWDYHKTPTNERVIRRLIDAITGWLARMSPDSNFVHYNYMKRVHAKAKPYRFLPPSIAHDARCCTLYYECPDYATETLGATSQGFRTVPILWLNAGWRHDITSDTPWFKGQRKLTYWSDDKSYDVYYREVGEYIRTQWNAGLCPGVLLHRPEPLNPVFARRMRVLIGGLNGG